MRIRLVLFAACAAFVAVANAQVEVQTSLGKIKGSIIKSRLGKDIYSFRGVRYGKPPVGERRFKPAEPVDPWKGTYDATQEGPSCIRSTGRNLSEDCLVLNIYSTKLQTSVNNVKRPVIVFIHPGGFTGFSSQSYIWGPQYYMDQDIVLVTLNYRLAALGFISTGTHHAPGNVGLKDQVAALRFVKDHISRFGGDPNSVTLTGTSAGGRSVMLHVLSPMSRGLFHRAVVMSGTATGPKPVPTNLNEITYKQARLVNCTTENLDSMFECLRKVPAQGFGSTISQFREFYGDPITIYSPVVEPKIPGVERFLHAQPEDIIRSRKFNHVPLISGVTKDEIVWTTLNAIQAAQKGNTTYFDQLNAEWYRVAPIIFQYDRTGEKSRAVSKAIKKFYFNDEPVGLKNADRFAQAHSDAIEGFPIYRTQNLMARYSSQPVYYYEFAYQGRFSFQTYTDTKKPYGVVHQDDLQYIFYISYLFPYFNSTDPEIPMVEKMTSMWANFAKTGKPIPMNNEYFKDVTWKTFTSTNNNYLQITDTFQMKNNLNSDRYALWDRLFPVPPYKEPPPY